jgi:hypothetical protein
MKSKIVLLLATTAILCFASDEPKWEQPTAKLTVRVVDEQGRPVPAAIVQIGFTEKPSPRDVSVKGTTDSHGEFTAEGHSDMRLFSDASKVGYYDSGCPAAKFTNFVNGKWQPWENTVTTTLRPIVKPVAMYARSFRELEIPVTGKPCGYDLEASDWVSPWGKGKVADFIFTVDERRYSGWRDFDVAVTLTFSNSLDGIQETKFPDIGRHSVFKWPREAPDTGYEPTFKARFTASEKGYHSTTSEDQAYFFRVRTVEKDGKIVGALYGKISSGISIEPRETKTCKIAFTYYLNPTPLDRNMEFDLKKNLFKNLKDEEQPREP